MLLLFFFQLETEEGMKREFKTCSLLKIFFGQTFFELQCSGKYKG